MQRLVMLYPSTDSLLANADQRHQKEEQDPGGESFENLFSRFADMKRKTCTYNLIHTYTRTHARTRKHTHPPTPTHSHPTHKSEHAESLPHEERKSYAERVVMAFWNAIGGDEEEMAENASAVDDT